MWLWIQVPVRYPQVQQCRLAPDHPWHTPTHESVPWELHWRWPCAKEGPASLCWVYRTGTCVKTYSQLQPRTQMAEKDTMVARKQSGQSLKFKIQCVTTTDFCELTGREIMRVDHSLYFFCLKLRLTWRVMSQKTGWKILLSGVQF